MVDMSGNEIKIGDKIQWFNSKGQIEYEFTVYVMDSSRVWGPDIPGAYFNDGELEHALNFHYPNKINTKIIPKTKWSGCTIKFNFI